MSSWNIEKTEDGDEQVSEQTKVLAKKRKRGAKKKKKVKVEPTGSDSEEEVVDTIQSID